ncbi:MAG: hypothetical protein KGJ41_00440 [Rhodospirillales bacterium]|nr:hypothetical protein [Rhodospirillales bacterium]MDE2197459.1 hypothetical protein [Rhodospirillales bacterium]
MPQQAALRGAEDFGSVEMLSILPGMVNDGYRLTNLAGWAGHMGNVG